MCMTDIYEERYELALDRIREIPKEHFGVPALEAYFAAMAEFVLLIDENRRFLEEGGGVANASLEELKKRTSTPNPPVRYLGWERSWGRSFLFCMWSCAA